MKGIPESFIEELKQETDIVELAEEVMDLKKMGSVYQSFCPDHKEKHPSLTLFPDTQTFYCFSCGAGKKNKTGSSDVIAFLMWLENCSFIEAVYKLANRKGMTVPKKELSKQDKERIQLYENCLKNNRSYWASLQGSPEHIEYLENRGIGKEEINKWRIGLVPYSDGTKVAGRIVFAIMNDWGQTVAFSYRNMEDTFPSHREADKDKGPKYYNSPQSPIFDKGSILYGLHNIKRTIREKDYVIVGEGFGDTIIAQKKGLPFVSIMGTAFTDKHISIIKRYTNNIVMWMDGDEGGINAVLRSLDPLRQAGLNVSIVYTPGNDPDDILSDLTEEEAEAFILENKRLTGQFEIDLILNKYRSRMSELKFQIVEELRPIFARIQNPTEKEVYAQQTAKDLGLSIDFFLEQLEGKE